MPIICEFCGSSFLDKRTFFIHLSRKEKHHFKNDASRIKYGMSKFVDIEKVLYLYNMGESKYELYKKFKIDITPLLGALGVKRNIKEAHNTQFYKNKLFDSVEQIYGVKNVSQNKEIKEKKKQTLIRKFNTINSFLIPDIKEKRKKALQEYFSDKSRLESTFKKVQKKWIERYGVTNFTKLPSFKKSQSKRQIKFFSSMSQEEKCEYTTKCRLALRDLIQSGYYVKGQESALEKRVQKVLSNMGILYQKHVYYKKYNYDIAINNKLFIEIQGDYWHANPMIYSESDIFVGGKKAIDIWKKDIIKKNVIEKNNRYYLALWESELKVMSDNDIKNWILYQISKIIKET